MTAVAEWFLLCIRDEEKMRQLSEDKIKGLLDGYMKSALDNIEWNKIMSKGPITLDDLEYHEETIAILMSDAREELACNDYRRIRERADRILEENGIEFKRESFAYLKLCRELFKADIKSMTMEKKTLYGDYSHEEENPFPPPVVAPAAIAHEEPSKSLSEVIQLFTADKETTKNWTPKTGEEYVAILALLKAIIGDVPVKSITYEVMVDFRDKLLRLPANMRKMPKYRDKKVQEILAMDVKDRMSESNVNKYLIRISTLFKFAVKRDYMGKNPAEGLQIKQRLRNDELRKVFTADDLTKLFHSEAYLIDEHKHSYYFWLPVLGLYTGCRINELCQLHLDDIKDVCGIWVLEVDEEAGDDKRVKSKAGRRVVPLHPFLVDDLKFIRYVESLKSRGECRLFPELPKQRDGYGQTASKWFGRYRKRCEVTEEGKVFHSFRHTFINNLKQNPEVKETMLVEVAGHEQGSITLGRYGKRYEPKVLMEHIIMKLDFGVDLDHLKRSRFVVER